MLVVYLPHLGRLQTVRLQPDKASDVTRRGRTAAALEHSDDGFRSEHFGDGGCCCKSGGAAPYDCNVTELAACRHSRGTRVGDLFTSRVLLLMRSGGGRGGYLGLLGPHGGRASNAYCLLAHRGQDRQACAGTRKNAGSEKSSELQIAPGGGGSCPMMTKQYITACRRPMRCCTNGSALSER